MKVLNVAPGAADSPTGDPPPAGYLFEVYTLQTTRAAWSEGRT